MTLFIIAVLVVASAGFFLFKKNPTEAKKIETEAKADFSKVVTDVKSEVAKFETKKSEPVKVVTPVAVVSPVVTTPVSVPKVTSPVSVVKK